MPEDQPVEPGQPAPETPQPTPAQELELVRSRLRSVIQENHKIAETCAQLQEDNAALQLKVEDLQERIVRQREIAITEIVLNKRLAAELAKAKAARPGPAPPARRWTRG